MPRGILSSSAVGRGSKETHASLLESGAKMRSNKPRLDKVKRLRHLSSAEAERLIPVKLTGIVTDLSGYKNSFFFQDSTGGISVDRSDSADVHAGDKVEIVGTSGPGLFAPVVLAPSKVTVTGHSAPPPTHRFMYGDLFGRRPRQPVGRNRRNRSTTPPELRRWTNTNFSTCVWISVAGLSMCCCKSLPVSTLHI